MNSLSSDFLGQNIEKHMLVRKISNPKCKIRSQLQILLYNESEPKIVQT
jgi:hypothetical protein